MNCSGLLGLRRLMGDTCSHKNCNHPSTFPAAFEWIFPLIQPNIDVSVASIGRTVATILFQAMCYLDTKPLQQLISAVGDINTINVTKWFSPAHFIVSRLNSTVYQHSSQVLLANGLDFHVVADEQYNQAAGYQAIRGQSPTSLALRYSQSFALYRNLLQSANIDIPSFVAREMRGTRLREDGWTETTLLTLFSLEFDPLPMSSIVCQNADCRLDPEIWSFGREVCWEMFLARLKQITTAILDPAVLLQHIRQTVASYEREKDTMCYTCQLHCLGSGFGSESDDSHFLLSIDYLC